MASRYPNDEYEQGSSKPSRPRNGFPPRRDKSFESFEMLPKPQYDFRSCRLKFPALITIQCYCQNSDRIHTEVLRIPDLPEDVLALKQLIFDSLNIPIICQLELTVRDIVLFDDQLFEHEVPIRVGDGMKLIYFARCGDKMSHLIKQGESISKFCFDFDINNYSNSLRCDLTVGSILSPVEKKKTHKNILMKNLKKMKKKIAKSTARKSVDDCNNETTPPPSPAPSNDQLLHDASTVRWALHNMYSDILLPWRNEGTLCHRLYLIQEDLVDKILDVWRWGRETSDLNIQRVCMLVLWDFGENWAERMILLMRNVHLEALDVFLDPKIDEDTKYACIGLIAGFGEFPRGQATIGTNEKFLFEISEYFCDTKSSFIETVIGGLLLSLASYHSIPQHMYNIRILENIRPVVDSLSFDSVDDFDLTYLLILFFMYLLKSPDYKIPREYSVHEFTDYFTDFSQNITDDLIADSEQEKQTSWASMVPFIDLFFVSEGSPIVRESGRNADFFKAYFSCAKTLFSAMMLQEENRDLFLNENLYGYLIFLSWRYKSDPIMHKYMLKVLSRFNPAPYKIPSLCHIATAKYAFITKGLGAAIELTNS